MLLQSHIKEKNYSSDNFNINSIKNNDKIQTKHKFK